MLAPVNTTVPVLAPLPIVSAPVPEMIPLRVAVWAADAAMVLVPAVRVIVLLIVPVVLANKVPPPRVTVPVDRFVPEVPPVATDKVPPLIVVPPV